MQKRKILTGFSCLLQPLGAAENDGKESDHSSRRSLKRVNDKKNMYAGLFICQVQVQVGASRFNVTFRVYSIACDVR